MTHAKRTPAKRRTPKANVNPMWMLVFACLLTLALLTLHHYPPDELGGDVAGWHEKP